MLQILSLTCDNASNNDIMINELAKLLPNFFTVNRTRCFLHIVNLVAKAILKLFDMPSANPTASSDDSAEDTSTPPIASEEDDDNDLERLASDVADVELDSGEFVEDTAPVREVLSKVRPELLLRVHH